MRSTTIAAAGLCCIAFSAHADIIHWFDGGFLSRGKFVSAPDGALYGTTYFGTPAGTAFKVTPGGLFTELHQFDSASEGYSPSGLLLGTDGNFYGQLAYGGAHSFGSVYRMTPAGQVTVLHAFLSNLVDGDSAWDPLMQAPDGNFYGVTAYAGVQGQGNIYRMTPAGDLTVIYQFTGVNDGYRPAGPLALGPDGALYGVTTVDTYGSVFRVTTAGAFTRLHHFNYADGSQPNGGLVQGPDGALYGTTKTGGERSGGTVFKITATGQFETVHTFENVANATRPNAALTLGSDGNFYGTTYSFGNDCGTAFMMTPSGVVTTFHQFTGAVDGCEPFNGLTEGPDGALYGAVYTGGPNFKGGVFRLAKPSGPLAPNWIQPPTPLAGSQLEADVGVPLNVSLRAGDPNIGDVVHIAASNLPATATLASTDGNAANATLAWTPTSADVGTRTVTFSATSGADGLSAAARSFAIRVMHRTMLEAKPGLLELSPPAVHLKMKAILTTAQGPVAGKVINFHSSVTDRKLCSATTDSAGVAACNSGLVDTLWRTAVNGYTAKFAGDAAYTPAWASAALIGP